MNNITTLGKDCCGCNACEQVCPKNCISFAPDSEGFMYPVVDNSLCVECGLCTKHCPLIADVSKSKAPDVYGAKYKNLSESFNSTSGGIFVPVAKYVLDKGGVVFGCAFDESLTARHICIDNAKDLQKLQGSKYVQSDTRGVYSKVKAELDKGRYVLFSGTGCQVAGLKAFLGCVPERLITVDIVCHGVPSPLLFEKYMDYLGKKLNGKITGYSFRSKQKKGWGRYYLVETAEKSKTADGLFDPYYNAFLNVKTLRESCYSCKFANSERASDITLADFWGIEFLNPDFYDKNGVSLVLVNSEKGKKLWKELSESIECIPSTLENAVKMNKNLSAPAKRPACRDDIYKGIDGDFNKYISEKLAVKIGLKSRIKTLIPISLKGKIKHCLKK